MREAAEYDSLRGNARSDLFIHEVVEVCLGPCDAWFIFALLNRGEGRLDVYTLACDLRSYEAVEVRSSDVGEVALSYNIIPSWHTHAHVLTQLLESV